MLPLCFSNKSSIFYYSIVPNYMLCKQTADILYPTGIQFSIEKLCVTNIEMFDQEIYTLYERLLDSGAFKEAYEFAKLHSLPESNITVHKVSLFVCLNYTLYQY